MSPDEQKRLATVEANQGHMEADVAEMKADIKTLIAALNMGQGAFYMVLKIGAVIAAVATVIAYVIDTAIKFFKG